MAWYSYGAHLRADYHHQSDPHCADVSCSDPDQHPIHLACCRAYFSGCVYFGWCARSRPLGMLSWKFGSLVNAPLLLPNRGKLKMAGQCQTTGSTGHYVNHDPLAFTSMSSILHSSWSTTTIMPTHIVQVLTPTYSVVVAAFRFPPVPPWVYLLDFCLSFVFETPHLHGCIFWIFENLWIFFI